MKRVTVATALIAFVLAAGTPLFGQGRDLAGSWVLDVEKSGKKEGPSKVIITLTDKEFTAKMGGDKAEPITFKLDGSETVLKNGKGKVAWKGNRLEAMLTTDRGSERASFSREGAWLVVEVTAEDGPLKLYFKKAPAQ